ncbi:hypothetical protein AAC387_Pa03g4411 [Persea americana]
MPYFIASFYERESKECFIMQHWIYQLKPLQHRSHQLSCTNWFPQFSECASGHLFCCSVIEYFCHYQCCHVGCHQSPLAQPETEALFSSSLLSPAVLLSDLTEQNIVEGSLSYCISVNLWRTYGFIIFYFVLEVWDLGARAQNGDAWSTVLVMVHAWFWCFKVFYLQMTLLPEIDLFK